MSKISIIRNCDKCGNLDSINTITGLCESCSNKKSLFRIGFTKTTYGEIIITAKNIEEARKKLDESDFDDEYDNKSDYIFDEEVDWIEEDLRRAE